MMRCNYVSRSIVLLGVFAVLFLFGKCGGFWDFSQSVISNGLANQKFPKQNDEITIVIDSGHGGCDPGKIGVHDEVEKDINLAIAKKLRHNLMHQGMNIIMTREDDHGLYQADSKNKKRDDLKKRVNIMNESQADLVISIHQNSFTDNRLNGAQVFYYDTSDESRKLAQEIQQGFLEYVDSNNIRQAKAADSYYILKKSKIPAVIVECGFLSNADEALKLNSEAYQEKIAWAIHMGVQRYLRQI